MSNSGAASGGNAAGPAGGELAGAYPNPTLAPAAVLARLESQFTGALQLVMGTGAGAGALVTLANGYGIAGFAANPPTPAVSLTSVSGAIGANVNLPVTVVTTVLTTASLGVGTWIVDAGASVLQGATPGMIEGRIDIGTATATLVGFPGDQAGPGANGQVLNLAMSALVTVTVAGTFVLNVYNASGATAATALLSTQNRGWPATGYRAVRIA